MVKLIERSGVPMDDAHCFSMRGRRSHRLTKHPILRCPAASSVYYRHRTRLDDNDEESILNVFRQVAGGALLMALLGSGAVAQDATIVGEVKKIDESSGSITLKQGPAPSLGFKEEMTLVYDVRDRAMLKQVKVGDTIKFEAESGDTGFTITKLEKGR